MAAPSTAGLVTWLEVAVAAVAVWRVTHLLVHEDGPGGGVARLRGFLTALPGGSPLDCFLCASVWVALAPGIVLGEGLTDRLLLISALSGIAILVERAGGSFRDPSPAEWREDDLPGHPPHADHPSHTDHHIEEEGDELLRTEA